MVIAVLFSGGVGSRMHSREMPKQFLSIHGKPVIVRTAELFQEHPEVDAIIIPCVREWVNHCRNLMDEYGITKVNTIIPGGATSQESTYIGLCAAERVANNEPSIVLIHDGVRPLITEDTISDCIASVKEYGSAITCVAMKETVVVSNSGESIDEIPVRANLRIARAPQCFWLNDILEAHRLARANKMDSFIDSASLMHSLGHSLHIIMGPNENIKITTPDDFFSVQAILNARENEQIYGIG